MLTMIRRSGTAVAVGVAIVALLSTQGSLGAQTAPTPTAASGSDMNMASPTAGSDMTMASPVAGTPISGEQTIPGTGERVITVPTPSFAQTPLPAAGGNAMGAMMDNCLDMMDMMMGGMPGPMGGGGMPGPMGDGGMPGPMDSPMEQCLSTMGTQSWDNRSDLMTFSTDQCQAMLGGDSMSGM